MNEYVDVAALIVSLQGVLDSALTSLLDIWVAIQLCLILAAFLIARLFGGAMRQRLRQLIDRVRTPVQLAPLTDALPSMLVSLLFVFLLWLIVGVMQEMTWPSRSYLLDVVASLLTAWVVIKLSSTFVRNAAVGNMLAIFAWSLAALNITGLLDPTIDALDSFATTFGELRISLLTVLKGVISATILLWVASVVSRLLETRINRAADLSPSVQVLLGKLVKITLLAIAVVVAMKSVGIDLTAFALFSGAIGLGIGFGLQKVVSNIISGVILLLDKSIKPGDVIELGETFGWISSLGARYVSVVTRDGKEYLIPNEDLITQRVVNWSFSNQLVRIEVPIGVSYASDPHVVRQLLADAAKKPERVMADPAPVCHLVAFGDSSLDFLLRFWIHDPEKGVMNIKGEVLLAAWDALKDAGIEIPYPHRKLLLPDPIRIDSSTS